LQEADRCREVAFQRGRAVSSDRRKKQRNRGSPTSVRGGNGRGAGGKNDSINEKETKRRKIMVLLKRKRFLNH